MKKINKIISMISLLLVLVACLFFIVLTFKTKRIICTWDIDEPKINSLMVAIILYEEEYGELPPEADFKRVLLEHKFITKEDVFYSGHKENTLLKYYQNGDSYFLIGPGENKRYDTPEDYNNVRVFYEKSENKTDDIIHFIGK
jgi:hypothetical protein